MTQIWRTASCKCTGIWWPRGETQLRPRTIEITQSYLPFTRSSNLGWSHLLVSSITEFELIIGRKGFADYRASLHILFNVVNQTCLQPQDASQLMALHRMYPTMHSTYSMVRDRHNSEVTWQEALQFCTLPQSNPFALYRLINRVRYWNEAGFGRHVEGRIMHSHICHTSGCSH